MSSVKDIGSLVQLSSVSLPQVAKHISDNEVLRDAVSKVVDHYNPSAVCLVFEGEKGLHIKAASGMSTGMLPFTSITRHTTGRPLPIIVCDASADDRFSEDSLVKGPPYARFFVGAPIMAYGKCVGTLCLLDAEPRSECMLDECSILEESAKTVGQHMESRCVTPKRATAMLLASQPRFASDLIAADGAGNALVLEYNQKKAQEELLMQQYHFQKSHYEIQLKYNDEMRNLQTQQQIAQQQVAAQQQQIVAQVHSANQQAQSAHMTAARTLHSSAASAAASSVALTPPNTAPMIPATPTVVTPSASYVPTVAAPAAYRSASMTVLPSAAVVGAPPASYALPATAYAS